jgi:hypothetical protein
MDNDKFVLDLVDRVYEDYFTVAPKYRTGERMQDLVTSAIREAMAQAYRDAAKSLDHEIENAVNWEAASARADKSAQCTSDCGEGASFHVRVTLQRFQTALEAKADEVKK